MAQPLDHVDTIDFDDIDGFTVIDRPSMPSSTPSFMTEDPPLLSASTVLPGGKNNKEKPMSVAFGSEKAPGHEPSADDFALELRRLDAAAQHGCRDDTVRCLLSSDRWPPFPASTTAAQKAEHGSSIRAPTEVSFVWVNPEDPKTDADVAGAGDSLWANSAMSYPQSIDLADFKSV